MADKIDSNATGLRYAQESALKTLPGGTTWFPLEPNSYGDMGATLTTVARNPINPSRQRQKGVTTDLDATVSFEMDLTNTNHIRLLESYMFSKTREKGTSAPLNGSRIAVTAVTATEYQMASAIPGIASGDLILAEGFNVPTNNGMKLVTGATGANLAVAGLGAETPPAGIASIRKVGRQYGAVGVLISNGVITLTGGAIGNMPVIPGEFIFIGDASAGNRQLNSGTGFARVVSIINQNNIIIDKPSWNITPEPGTGKTLRVFFGSVIRNEPLPVDIVRTSLQFERSLGEDNNGTMHQYVEGAVANEFTLNVAQADKVTAEFAFIACDSSIRTGTQGSKAGARPSTPKEDAFNTSSDVRRLAFTTLGTNTPLFMYATDMTLAMNNNASGAKAISVLGNFDINTGAFDVSGSVTAYFQDTRAVEAVRNNSDVSMDIILVKNNKGIVWDVPLLALGNGILAVEQDQAITIPLDTIAAESQFGHTLLYVNFPYLPDNA